jgi:hypothetical protein
VHLVGRFFQRSRSEILAVCFAASALVVVGMTFRAAPSLSRGSTRPTAEAEQALAEAIFASTTSRFDTTIADEDVQRKFVQAIGLTSDRARAYVFMADNGSGWLAMSRGIRSLIEQIERNPSFDVCHDALPDYPPAYGAELESLLKRSLARHPAGRAEFKPGVPMPAIDALGAVGDKSIPCYLAAIAESPNYTPAWCALALAATGDLKLWALREWSERDPKNALPVLLHAAAVVDRDDVEAVTLIEMGAHRPECREPHPLPPRTFMLRYPDREELAEMKLTDTQVNEIALRNLIWLSESPRIWGTPSRELRFLWGTLRADAETAYVNGDRDRALLLAATLLRLGNCLFTNSAADDDLGITGVLMIGDATRLLRSDRDPAIANVHAILTAKRMEFAAQWREQIEQNKAECTVEAALRGDVDIAGEWQRRWGTLVGASDLSAAVGQSSLAIRASLSLDR